MKEVRNLLLKQRKAFTGIEENNITKKEWNEDLHPRGEDGRFAGGGGSSDNASVDSDNISSSYSAIGANNSIPEMTKKNLDKHWGSLRDHSKEYPGFTKNEYAARALELVRSPVGGNIDGYKAADGAIVRYDRKENDFVKGYHTGVATMYKPLDGEKYFERVMKREGGMKND